MSREVALVIFVLISIAHFAGQWMLWARGSPLDQWIHPWNKFGVAITYLTLWLIGVSALAGYITT